MARYLSRGRAAKCYLGWFSTHSLSRLAAPQRSLTITMTKPSKNKQITELERRQALGRKMGGPDSIAFQHSRGKLTVRERIDALADEGSFDEIGVLAGSPEWNGNSLKSLTPANTLIGKIKINGRKVFVNGGDFTIRGGALDAQRLEEPQLRF